MVLFFLKKTSLFVYYMYSPYIVSKSLRHQILTLNPNKNYHYQIESFIDLKIISLQREIFY